MVTNLTPEQVHDMLTSDEDFLLIYVLRPEMFEEEHIPKAINIQFDHLEEHVPLIATKDRKIVLYCASLECQASPKAAKLLEDMGYTNVFDLEAGMSGYAEAGFPTITQ